MKHRLVVYLSHALGEEERNGAMQDNLANFSEWFRFFLKTTRYIVLAPWAMYASLQSEKISIGRRLVDSMTIIERCDVVAQCGGVLSPHMADFEARAARRVGTPIADLLSFGVMPPDPTEDNAQVVIRRIERAITRQPRRVWMPLLTPTDIETLKAARHGLQVHLPGEHDAGVALLDRILEAAHEDEG
jgi:hypothetical protein